MPIALLAGLFLSWWCLIPFVLKTNAKYSHGRPPPIVVIFHSILILLVLVKMLAKKLSKKFAKELSKKQACRFSDERTNARISP